MPAVPQRAPAPRRHCHLQETPGQHGPAPGQQGCDLCTAEQGAPAATGLSQHTEKRAAASPPLCLSNRTGAELTWLLRSRDATKQTLPTPPLFQARKGAPCFEQQGTCL